MDGPAEQYTQALHKKFRYRATWAPGAPIRIGDIGVIEDGTFTLKSTLGSMGMPTPRVRRDPRADDEWQFESSKDVSWIAKAKGTVSATVPNVPKGKLGAAISFGKQGAVVLSLKDVTIQMLEDVVAIEDAMWDLLERDLWDQDWAIITETVQAKRGTVLISAGSNAKVELMAKGSATAGPVKLGDISMGFSLVSKQGMHTTFVAKDGLTPMYRAIRFKDDFWRGLKLTGLDAAAPPQKPGEPARRQIARPRTSPFEKISAIRD